MRSHKSNTIETSLSAMRARFISYPVVPSMLSFSAISSQDNANVGCRAARRRFNQNMWQERNRGSETAPRRQQPDFKYPNIAGLPSLRLGGAAEHLKARNLAGKFHRGNALADGKARLRAQREHVEGCVSFSVITQPKGQTYGGTVCVSCAV